MTKEIGDYILHNFIYMKKKKLIIAVEREKKKRKYYFGKFSFTRLPSTLRPGSGQVGRK